MRALFEAEPARRSSLLDIDRRSEVAAWAAIAVVSAVIRMLLLARLPLSETEASLAVRVWNAVLGQVDTSLAAGASPLLAHAMAAVFWLFGPSDIGARVTPAIFGVALALTPLLVADRIGSRGALAAGILLAFSPIAVQVSRMVDPAAATAAISMLVVLSAWRLATDRPVWSPWTLAAGIGLALADDAGAVIALGTAVLAAAATWGGSPRGWLASLSNLRERGGYRAAAGPALMAAGIALVVASGATMDLTGFGFPFGDLWGGVGRFLTPAPFPTRNLAAVLAYGWPVLILGAIGFVRGVRAGDHLALFLGQWTLLLVALAAVVGQSALALAVLPIGPAAILAGIAVEQLSGELYRRFSSRVWAAALVLLILGGVAMSALANSVGAGHGLPPIGISGLLLTVAAVAAVWRFKLAPGEVGPSLALSELLIIGALSLGGIARLSFGGSPPGSEPLPREQTDPAIRPAFHDMTILASADPSRVLLVSPTTPEVIRWYGRSIPETPRDRGVTPNPYVVEPVAGTTAATTSLGPQGPRTPWKVTSVLSRNDLNPLGIARWAVARVGLMQGRPNDIIISR